jgi:peptide-methionine (S)-S-oxide reductase
MEKATLAGGCFWCTEALFKRLNGVTSVAPGYSGGELENPTYEQVCLGNTGYAESIQIEFDPETISFRKILEVFFYTHDPTTLNRQGNDVGPQYRSVIFYHNDEQRQIAKNLIKEIENNKKFKLPILTAIEKYKNFYVAEDYHKNYYEKNKNVPYCDITITPKISKLIDKFNNIVKEEYK